ncbi:MAG: 3-oxoacyl-[acyl-carrier-protein] reductase [Parachlamydiales bacterium]
MQVKDRVAVVTGGTAGIGRAIALKLAGAGADVVIFGRNAERGAEVVKEIEALGRKGTFIGVDVADASAVEAAIERVLQEHGKVDILVNNAGVTRDGLLMRMSEEQWDAVLDTNLKAAWASCKAASRAMMKARYGKIINISSVVGLTGNAGQAHYAASKSGLIGFTKSLAKELASRGVCANCVAPGFIDTQMTEVLPDGVKEVILNQVPLKRLGNPEEVADAVLFLASDCASYITGQVLTVDGGMVMS